MRLRRGIVGPCQIADPLLLQHSKLSFGFALVDWIFQYFQAFAIYAKQFLFLKHHPVVHDDFGVLKAQDAGRACPYACESPTITTFRRMGYF